MSQLTYLEQVAGFPGLIYDLGPNDIVTGVSQEASAETPFGSGVVRGTTDDGVKLPAASTDIPRGVVVHAHNYAPDIEVGDTGLKPKTCFGVMRRGRIWVTVVTAVAAGDRAYLYYAGSNPKGSWGNAEVSGETIDCTAEALFVSTAAEDGLAVLEVDFTNS